MVELFCRNSQCVMPVGCFCRGAPSLIFDGILNVTLSEEVSTTGVTQGNLELPLHPNSPKPLHKQFLVDYPNIFQNSFFYKSLLISCFCISLYYLAFQEITSVTSVGGNVV